MNVLPGVSATNGQISTHFAKSYSRAKSIIITFGTGEYNLDGALDESHAFCWLARTNEAAVGAYPDYDPTRDVVEFQIHVGSETLPQYPIRSLAEFAYPSEEGVGFDRCC